MAATLTVEEKLAVASYLAGKPVEPFQMPPMPEPQGLCPPGSSPLASLLEGPIWNGWGVDHDNSRFQPAAMAALEAGDVPRLKLKWAFGFPHSVAAWSQPVVAGGRVFMGSMLGTIYSLDARTGCTHWFFQACPQGVRAAISIGPGFGPAKFVAYAGDIESNVYALDALTGKELWKVKVEEHPFSRITGAPKLHAGRLYVPVASLEEGAATNPKYECCTFRGSIVALDAQTGKQIWKTYTIPNTPRPTRRTVGGTQLHGPSGAGIWSSPTIDEKLGRLYAATGNNYSDPERGHGDSVLAIGLGSGKIAWARKTTPGDRWHAGCGASDKVTCPKDEGPDHDFGSSPILRTLSNGRRVLLAGQKSGVLHFLDPDRNGAVIRQVRLGQGGLLGGIEWGPAAMADNVFVAISDHDFNDPEAGGGLTAVQIATGEKLWQTPAPKPGCIGERRCSAAQPAAVTAIPGVVFSGSLDGHLRAYSAADGKILWDLNTRQRYETVNGVPAAGGSLNAAGPSVVNGMLYVNSGYGFFGGSPGNVLLAFSADGQ